MRNKFFIFLSLIFFGLNSFAGSQIEEYLLIGDEGYCSTIASLQSTIDSETESYNIFLKLYQKQPEGSEKQIEYKEMVDSFSESLQKSKDRMQQFTQSEFVTVKLILDQDYTIDESKLIFENGNIEILPYQSQADSKITYLKGSVRVTIYGAILCGENNNESDFISRAEDLFSEIFSN